MAAGGSARASQRRCVLALLGLIVVAAAGILGASVGYSYGAYSSSRWAPLRIESAAPDGMAMANVKAPAGQETAIVPLLLPQLADFAACADGNGNNFANGTTLPVPLRCPKASLGGRTVVDVGLKSGIETLGACELNATIFAFEPVPEFVADIAAKLQKLGVTYDTLQVPMPDALHRLEAGSQDSAVVALSGESAYRPPAVPQELLAAARARAEEARQGGKCHVVLVNAAAGAEARWTTLWTNNGWGASLVDKLSPRNQMAGKTWRVVPTLRVDSVVPQQDIYLMKLDVQGYEHEVIRGASKLFAGTHGSVRQLWSELWETGLRKAKTTVADYLVELQKHGMACFETTSRAQLLADSTKCQAAMATNSTLRALYGSSVSSTDARVAQALKVECGDDPAHYHFFEDMWCVNVRHHS